MMCASYSQRSRAVAAALLAGCCDHVFDVGAIVDCVDSPPSFGWLFGKSNKPGPLPTLTADGHAAGQLAGQRRQGQRRDSRPAVTQSAVYAAASDGTLVRVDAASGRVVWRINAGQKIAAGPGADDAHVVVGTDKGDVLAFDADGKPAWTSHVSSEVIAPPTRRRRRRRSYSPATAASTASTSADGKTQVGQPADESAADDPQLRRRRDRARRRCSPARPAAACSPLDIITGQRRRGTRQSRRPKAPPSSSASPTSRACRYVDERQVCAVAYQGRVACFDIVRGTLHLVARSCRASLGLTGDAKHLYVTDDKGAVQALDKTSGASVWKQDALGGPQDRRPAARRRLCRRRRCRRLSASAGARRRRLRRPACHRWPARRRRNPMLLAGSALVASPTAATLYSVTAR